MMQTEFEFSEERLSSLMAKRLERENAPEPVPAAVRSLHEAGYLPGQIAHRLEMSRVDVERFVKRLKPVEPVRYGT